MRQILVRACSLFVLAVSGTSLAAQEVAQQAAVPLYDNLGSYRYRVSASPQAQRYFDQGIRLYYAFNHAEAIRAFAEAARLDDGCAMCRWGIALSYGPNINAAMDSASAVAAFAAVRMAQAHAGHATDRERALIAALATRYVAVPPSDRAALDSAYSRAMAEVVQRFPDDDDAAVLYAESVMDLSPWSYWNPDRTPRAGTPELLAQLERVLARTPDHPGANHFYIHAVEAVDPARAVPMAERLASLMPGAGHLVHMPGHIYVRVGRYADAIRANEHAVHADETFIRDQRPAFGTYLAGYYPHNYDFLAFAASMIGRREQAMQAAEKMATIATPEMLRTPELTFTQHHNTRHLQLKVRFSEWDAILAAQEPPADLPHARSMWHYARGRALAARGDTAGAAAALARLRQAAMNPVLSSRRLEFNTAGAVLGIAVEVLAGHEAEARGDRDAAVRHLEAAVRLEDALTYGEPPEWTIPVRQELGAVLLRAGRASDAERAFRQDLERFPENGWSLRGLAEALRAQGRSAAVDSVMARFGKIWEGADVPGSASAVTGTQLVVVTTAGWDSTGGELRRFFRRSPDAPWQQEGEATPVVVGRTGLAWGVGLEREGPRKVEGDGRAPAGIFPVTTAFGFAPADSASWLRMPYIALSPNTECVDDVASAHYNSIVERDRVPSVDWASSERMRRIPQYRLGLVAGYNTAPPVKGRGSCIFLHIWEAPGTPTVGCTAMDADVLAGLMGWLDPRARPQVVQLPAAEYAQLQDAWGLPALH